MNTIKNKLRKVAVVRSMGHFFRLIAKYVRQIKGLNVIRCIDRQQLEKVTYSDLLCILDVGKYKYSLVKAHNIALKKIKEKSKIGPIKIAFQVSFLSTWIGDELLTHFMNDDRFDVTVVIVWQRNSSKEKEIPRLREHFDKVGVKYQILEDSASPSEFDIIIYTSPYLNILSGFGEKNIPLSTLVCHIPYGFYAAAIQDMQFNLPIHNINWRNYTLSSYYLCLAAKYCRINTYGMVYSGYPKMDKAYNETIGETARWKLAGDSNQVKKIIFAPHHSIDAEPYFSTFDQNMFFMLEYAKNNPTTTSWVFKPHPLLRISAVSNGLFKTAEDYDKYLKRWNDLPNAIVEEGEYLQYMASSDAMILDSVSFMSEYLYFHKPILFLEREGIAMNEFGEELKEVLYRCSGNDYAAISNFITNSIDCDEMKMARDNFFDSHLNYYRKNGYLASEFIYRDIVDSILGKTGDKTLD